MALRILGIDLGSHSVKVAEVRSRFRSAEVVNLWRAPVEAAGSFPTLAEQLTALSTVLQPGVRADVVVVALPGAGSATHRLTFPFSDTRRLEQTLGFEVEGQIPFDLSEVVYDYEIVNQVPGKRGVPARTDALVGVARIAAVSDLVAGMGPLGVDPRIVTLPGLAMQALLAQSIEAEGGDALLDLGHTRVSLLVRENGHASLARILDGGGRVLTAALERLRGFDRSAAEALKEQSSLIEGDPEIQQTLTKPLLPMIREVRQTLRQVESLSRIPITKLWLTGGTAKLHGLPELLERELGIPARLLPSPKFPGTSFSAEETQAATLAIGLALRGHASGRGARFNLRRGDQSFQGDFARIRGRVLRTAALVLVLAMCFGVRAYAELYLLGKREKQIDDAICAQTKLTVGKCVKDPTVAKSLLSAAGAVGETVIPDQSAVGVLAETSSRMTVEGAKVSEMDVGLEQVQLRGAADSFETVDKVVTALKGYHCFSDVQRGRVQKSRDATEIEFQLSARNDCVAGGTP